MPRRAGHSEQARSTQPNFSKKVAPRLITLPNPEVTREPDGLTIVSQPKEQSLLIAHRLLIPAYRILLADYI